MNIKYLLPACQILRDFREGNARKFTACQLCFCVSVMVIIKISKSTDVFLRARADYLSFRPQRECDSNTPFTPTKLGSLNKVLDYLVCRLRFAVILRGEIANHLANIF